MELARVSALECVGGLLSFFPSVFVSFVLTFMFWVGVLFAFVVVFVLFLHRVQNVGKTRSNRKFPSAKVLFRASASFAARLYLMRAAL